MWWICSDVDKGDGRKEEECDGG
jgi:hypothetical protein